MNQIGIWQISEEGPERLRPSSISLEAKLEGWIESDATLVDSSLTIVGRQLHLDAGPLDLLAVDPQGQWHVIEIKRGTVNRDTIAQALDYAACLSQISAEELNDKVDQYLRARDPSNPHTLKDIMALRGGGTEEEEGGRAVSIMVVGTGRDPGLERIVNYLGNRLPVRVVTFHVFEADSDHPILVRELTESDTEPAKVAAGPASTIETVSAVADTNGFGTPFRAILAAAQARGLYARPRKACIMYTPPNHGNRTLFTVWNAPWTAAKHGTVPAWIGSEVFPEFFDVTKEASVSALGPQGFRDLTAEDASRFIRGLNDVLDQVTVSDEL